VINGLYCLFAIRADSHFSHFLGRIYTYKAGGRLIVELPIRQLSPVRAVFPDLKSGLWIYDGGRETVLSSFRSLTFV